MNTQKGFSTVLGLLVVLVIVGGGIYAYRQNDVDMFNIERVNPEIGDVFNATSSEDTYSCSENTDCQKSEFCYFKPGGEKGSCTGRWDQKGEETPEYKESQSVNKNDLIPCSKNEECESSESCLLVPGGNTGYCAIENILQSNFDTVYTNSFYGFSFKHPSATKLLVDIKNNGAQPLVIRVEKKGNWSFLTIDDNEEYPIPRMLRVIEENKFTVNNMEVTKTRHDTGTNSNAEYLTYDFVISGQSYLFYNDIQDSGSGKEVSVFIEGLIKTFIKN